MAHREVFTWIDDIKIDVNPKRRALERFPQRFERFLGQGVDAQDSRPLQVGIFARIQLPSADQKRALAGERARGSPRQPSAEQAAYVGEAHATQVLRGARLRR